MQRATMMAAIGALSLYLSAPAICLPSLLTDGPAAAREETAVQPIRWVIRCRIVRV